MPTTVIRLHTKRSGWLAGLVLATCAPLTAYGQEPFSQIDISGAATFNVKGGSFTESRIYDYWSPDRGAELAFLTPFYLGDAEVGIAIHPYDAVSPAAPEFDAMLVFLGWGFNWEITPGFFWYNGMRLGNNRMSFDDDTFPGVKNESEFMLGVQTRATVHLFRQTGVFAAAHLTQTYTYIRFRTVHISAGLTTSLSAPAWLQTILR